MKELLSNLSVTQIILIVFMIAMAIKEVISLIDFFRNKIKSSSTKEQKQKDEKQEILNEINKIHTMVAKNEEECRKIASQLADFKVETIQKLEQQQETLGTLIESDIDDIKSYIVKQYHSFTTQGWIDDFSMDVIEKRFAHYKKEGGNSYAEHLVEKLRQLPNHP